MIPGWEKSMAQITRVGVLRFFGKKEGICGVFAWLALFAFLMEEKKKKRRGELGEVGEGFVMGRVGVGGEDSWGACGEGWNSSCHIGMGRAWFVSFFISIYCSFGNYNINLMSDFGFWN